MNPWERGRETDRQLLGWIWDDDAKVRWWVWLIVAAFFLPSAVWNFALGREGSAIASGITVVGFVVLALRRRRRRP